MQEQTRPDLAHAASEMAANHIKVVQYVETLPSRIDELVAATAREDWNEVRRASRHLARGSRACGYRAVSALAERVHHEVNRPHNLLGVKRSLIRLIGTCGRTGQRRAGTTTR